MRQTALGLLALSIGATALRLAAGCSGSSGGGGTRDATDEKDTQLRDAGLTEDGNPLGEAGPWTPFDGYDPTCGFFVPAAPSALPAPIAWQVCAPNALPSGAACRQMVTDWKPWKDGTTISTSLPTTVSAAGVVTMMLSRFVEADATGDGLPGRKIYRMIAEADGPIRNAILETASGMCTLGTNDVREGTYAYRVFDSEAAPLSSFGGGMIGGAVGQLTPRVLTHYHDKAVDRDYLAGQNSFMELSAGEFVERSWADGSTIAIAWQASQDPGLAAPETTRFGDDLFFGVSSSSVAKVKHYRRGKGTEEFIAFDDNATNQGAGDFGTDGKDMVWTESANGYVPPGIPATVSIMTAPFVTDPSVIVKRRLRSTTGYGFAAAATTVGCGYALRWSTQANGDAAATSGVLLIRLADGVSWLLAENASPTWQIVHPLAVTCSEAFFVVNTPAAGGQSSTVARVRIDTLGPGTLPD